MSRLECEEFDHLWTGGLRTDPPAADYEKAEREFLAVASSFVRQYPQMGALVLECTGFPPFARALQRELAQPRSISPSSPGAPCWITRIL